MSSPIINRALLSLPPRNSPLYVGLLASYNFENAATLGLDSLGNFTMTPTGSPAQATGIVGSGVQMLTATAQYFTVAGALTTAGQSRTVAFWVKPGDSTVQRPIASASTSYQSGSPLWQIVCARAGKFGLFHAGAYWDSTSASTSGVWTHLAYTFDASNNSVGFWINGVREVTQTGADSNSANTFYLGAGYNANMDGVVDMLCVWNRALSAAEVGLHYNNGNGVALV